MVYQLRLPPKANRGKKEGQKAACRNEDAALRVRNAERQNDKLTRPTPLTLPQASPPPRGSKHVSAPTKNKPCPTTQAQMEPYLSGVYLHLTPPRTDIAASRDTDVDQSLEASRSQALAYAASTPSPVFPYQAHSSDAEITQDFTSWT